MSTHPLVPVPRTRIKLAVFATATIVAAAVGLPGAAVAALALTSLAIPLAVALAGGAPLLRELLVPSARGRAGRGLGHTPEERERFVT